MAKAKSTKPRDLIRWRVSLITSTKFIDFTMAPDAETAGEQVAEAYDIGDELRHRLMAIRDDLWHQWNPPGPSAFVPARAYSTAGVFNYGQH
jgi:hypothetical protein